MACKGLRISTLQSTYRVLRRGLGDPDPPMTDKETQLSEAATPNIVNSTYDFFKSSQSLGNLTSDVSLLFLQKVIKNLIFNQR